MWADLLQPGALAVLRTGLTPGAIAAMSFSEFVERIRLHRAGRRVWRFKSVSSTLDYATPIPLGGPIE